MMSEERMAEEAIIARRIRRVRRARHIRRVRGCLLAIVLMAALAIYAGGRAVHGPAEAAPPVREGGAAQLSQAPAVREPQAGAYAGLTTGKGDCFTYYAVSRALLTVLEIDNLPVERVGGEARHYWNLVDCGDGWYHFDACPRSSRLPYFLSFMFTDQQAADYTAEAGRCYYDFDGTLLPERAQEIITP